MVDPPFKHLQLFRALICSCPASSSMLNSVKGLPGTDI